MICKDCPDFRRFGVNIGYCIRHYHFCYCMQPCQERELADKPVTIKVARPGDSPRV